MYNIYLYHFSYTSIKIIEILIPTTTSTKIKVKKKMTHFLKGRKHHRGSSTRMFQGV